MYRMTSTVRKSSKSNGTSQNKIANKKQISDTLYLMQNQNDILKVKNIDLSNKVDSLNIELRQRTQRISQSQKDCQVLRQSINNSYFTKDIQLQNQKLKLIDKISLGKNNVSIYKSKIEDARTSVVLQERKIPHLIADKHHLQQQLRISKMENQGSKTILINLQKQHQDLRERNNKLSLKKYSYQPEQQVISEQIQQRIRLIKNLNTNQKAWRVEKVSRLIKNILMKLFQRKMKQSFLMIQRYGLKKQILKKKMILLGHIRKNYLNFVKAKTLTKFRESLKPLNQQFQCMRILQDMRKRRVRAKIWRIWRDETAKAEYSLIRKYQCQNTIQKISQTIIKSLLISSFNKLKYYKNHHFSIIGVSKIYSTISQNLNKCLFSFISSLKQSQNKHQIQIEVQKSAEQHSKMLILSKVFYQWIGLSKDNKKQSLSLKFKYFKRLKKIFVIKKRNVLNQMLGVSKMKINDVNIKSICFSALKQQLYLIKQQTVLEEKQKVETTFHQLISDTSQRQKFDIKLDKEHALVKIQKYFQKKAKLAFSIWRKQNSRIKHFMRIISILQFKIYEIINFSFSRIQIKRFEKLKLSIKDKIASCDYSYNYLVQQNTHIKEVLDKKSHQLQKAKFLGILKRLVRNQKQIKHQYFFKFLRNGYKFWKVRKNLQNIDHLMSKKIKIVFFFLLKQNKKQKAYEQKIENYIRRRDQEQLQKYLKNSLQSLRFVRQRNVRMRRALSGIFDRNLEINFFQAFGKMRNQGYQFQINQITNIQKSINSSINSTNDDIKVTQQWIEKLTERLKNKEQTFRQRKTMSIYKFFLKNIKVQVGSYIWRWKNKVEEEKRIMKFVDVLDKKTQSMIKMKFLLALQKTQGQLQKRQLETRLQKYQTQYESSNVQYQKFVTNSEQQSIKMKQQNLENQKLTLQYQKRTQRMNDIKVSSFLKYWGKNICKFVFRQWKNQKIQFLQKWTRVFNMLDTHGIRNAFEKMSQQIRFELVKDRIKLNLSKIYNKAYKHNVGVGFRIWRNVNIFKKIKENENELKQAMKGMEHIEGHYQMVKSKYYEQVDYRIHNQRLRKLTNAWRIYTQRKLKNNAKKLSLQSWLRTGYSAQAINLLKRNKTKSLAFKTKINNFQDKFVIRKAKAFLQYLYNVKEKKHSIQKLFIQKFCFYSIHKLNQELFTRIKNYYRQNEINDKDRRTFNIQKVINCFQKKRKDILCQNMRLWNRNMYMINIQKILMKRLVRNSMNSRVKDIFYAWKLQKEARFMVIEHTQEGQVKKRKVEIQRLKKFLDDYKKQKGLLLQNQEGNFVVSPRFQQNKQKQVKRENVLKYKFISRVVLAMNGYQSSIKSWNNLNLFMKLRKKCQKTALLVKNRMQKTDLYTTFKIWHNGVKELRKMFDDMERKDLIRILNKEKDKMQIEYSKKVDVEEKIQRELRRYKVLSYQDKRKQRICSQILFKEARKVKLFAFNSWRKRLQQMKDHDEYQLQSRGNMKILKMQEDVQQLQAQAREMQEHNRMLKEAVNEALELAELIKRISQERDELKRQLNESNITCENLLQQNEELNNKLILAQKEAMNLLSLSAKGI